MQAGFVRAQWSLQHGSQTLTTYTAECDEGRYDIENALIVESVELKADEWDEFTNNLLAPREWLKGKGGTDSATEGPWREGKPFHSWSRADIKLFRETSYRKVIEVIGPKDKFIYVDPQGHDYARYVGLPTEKKPTKISPLILDDPGPITPKAPKTDSTRVRVAAQLLALLEDDASVEDW